MGTRGEEAALATANALYNLYVSIHNPQQSPEEGQIHVQSPAVALLRIEVTRRHARADGGAPVKLCVVPLNILHELVDVWGAHDAPVALVAHQWVIFWRRHIRARILGMTGQQQRATCSLFLRCSAESSTQSNLIQSNPIQIKCNPEAQHKLHRQP